MPRRKREAQPEIWFAETGQGTEDDVAARELAAARMPTGDSRISRIDVQPGGIFPNVIIRDGVDLMAPEHQGEHPEYLRNETVTLLPEHVAYLFEVMNRHDNTEFYDHLDAVRAEHGEAPAAEPQT